MIFRRGDLVRFKPDPPFEIPDPTIEGQVGMIIDLHMERWGAASPGDWANVLWQDGATTDTSLCDLVPCDDAGW